MRQLVFAALLVSGCSSESDTARKAEIQAEIAAEEAVAVAALRAGPTVISQATVEGGTVTVMNVPFDTDEHHRCVLYQGATGAAIDCPVEVYFDPAAGHDFGPQDPY